MTTRFLRGLWVLGWLFFLLLTVQAFHARPYPADLPLLHWVQALPLGPVGTWLGALSWVDYGIGGPLTLAAVLVFLAACRWWSALATMAVAPLGSLLVYVVKIITVRPRPALPDALQRGLGESDSAFPSGHVVFTCYVFGLLGVILWRRLPPSNLRTAAVAVLWSVPPLMALSRVWVGEHWPSDVFAGLVLGGMWLWTLVWINQRLRRVLQ
ncbi:MAG: phosphatase PAP2 family protein [Candidatus Dormibacteria bacterium]